MIKKGVNMDKNKKKLLIKIICQLIIFSFISIIVWFTWWWTAFLSFIPFAIIWTYWWFNIFEFITSISIELKYRNIWAIINGLFVLFIVVGVTTFSMAFDTGDNNINIKPMVIFITNIILIIVSLIIFIINIINIVKKYYSLLKEIIKNKIKCNNVRQHCT
jgi:hypothetical protein